MEIETGGGECAGEEEEGVIGDGQNREWMIDFYGRRKREGEYWRLGSCEVAGAFEAETQEAGGWAHAHGRKGAGGGGIKPNPLEAAAVERIVVKVKVSD